MVLIGENELLLSDCQNLINDQTATSLPGGGTITRVQGNARGTASFSPSCTVTLANTPVSGDLLVLVSGVGSGTPAAISSITQIGVTWAFQVLKKGGQGQMQSEIWVGVIGSGASKTITVTYASSQQDVVCDVCEYSGLQTSGFLDQSVTYTGGASANPTTGTTGTTIQPVELCVGAITMNGGVSFSNPINGFTMLDGAARSFATTGYFEYITSATGAYGSGCTASNTYYWSACLITLKAALTLGVAKTYSGTIPKNELLLYNIALNNPTGGDSYVELAIKLNGIAVYGTGKNGVSGGSLPLSAGETATISGILYAPSGAFTLSIFGISPLANVCQITAVQLGLCNFNDLSAQATAYTDALTVSTSPRATPIGNLTQTLLYLRACSNDANSVQFENQGDNFTYGVQVALDSVQQTWTERFQGSDGARAASALLVLPLTVGEGVTHQITITKRNAQTNVQLSCVALCPWLLPPTNYFPITTFSFGNQCTFYATLEPLFSQPTMAVCIGKIHAITFGATTDFYASQSGTGILNINYQFNYIDVTNSIISAYGFGGCITFVGVDTV